MQTVVSRTIPPWVVRSVEMALHPRAVKQSLILESPKSARWDIIVELADGTEVLAWVDKEDQTPVGVEAMVKQALQDTGLGE